MTINNTFPNPLNNKEKMERVFFLSEDPSEGVLTLKLLLLFGVKDLRTFFYPNKSIQFIYATGNDTL